MLDVTDMYGLWHRSLLVRADATRDTSAWVAWLQGPTLFADLRVPAGRPSFRGVRGRYDLTSAQVAWIAGQEGFAGRLEREGEFFVWRRALDFQPAPLTPDSGRIRLEANLLVEEGRYAPYVEHWHRQPGPRAPAVALHLRDEQSGCGGFIVRVGDVFMYARAGTSAPLPIGTLLSDHVEAAASLRDAQELVDCEISFGHVTPAGWIIERSSLPFREGARLDPEASPSAHRCQSADVTPDGRATHRVWEIIEVEGDAVALDAPSGRDALAADSPKQDTRRSAMSTPSDFSGIPLVDITALRKGTRDEQGRVAEELGRAAREVGFLYVTGSGVDERLFENLLGATKQFFALPLEKKMEVYIGKSRNHRGYVPEGEEVFASGTKDKKEAFDMQRDLPADDPDYLAGNPLLGPNQWPALPGFKEAASAYYEAVFALGRTLMHGFAMALSEEPDFFDAYITKPPSQLRLIHYPFDAAATDATGIGAHTDYECFTLLRSTAPGLEVLNGAGTWIDAPPVPGAFVVNIGDMLEIWTNGEFVATSHRVRKVREERYSFPLFFTVDYHTEVKPMPRFVTDAAPARPSLSAGEHLYAQTVQSFTYQKERLARGEITLPERSKGLSSFGQEALQKRVG